MQTLQDTLGEGESRDKASDLAVSSNIERIKGEIVKNNEEMVEYEEVLEVVRAVVSPVAILPPTQDTRYTPNNTIPDHQSTPIDHQSISLNYKSTPNVSLNHHTYVLTTLFFLFFNTLIINLIRPLYLDVNHYPFIYLAINFYHLCHSLFF